MLLVLMVMMSVLVFSTTSISATIYSTKGNGLVKDNRVKFIPVDYADLISKYTVNTESMTVGINGSANFLYVNSKTDMQVTSGIQVSTFEQVQAKPEDKNFSVPKLKMKHENRLEFDSMIDFINFGEGKREDKENNAVITADINLSGSGLHKVVFVNADVVKVNIPNQGEVYNNLIIITPGIFNINSLKSGATYGHVSIICKELIIENHSTGAINFNPQPHFPLQESKDKLNELINEFLDLDYSGDGTSKEWDIIEMSY